MITDRQMRLLIKELARIKPLATAAAKAGMSERTAGRWRQRGKLPSEMVEPRYWRTREDPFAKVWLEVEAMLELGGALQAKVVFEQLQKPYPGRFQPDQLRTLQRKVRRWRALGGGDKEVYFLQEREPGWQCQSDFTDMGKLGGRWRAGRTSNWSITSCWRTRTGSGSGLRIRRRSKRWWRACKRAYRCWGRCRESTGLTTCRRPGPPARCPTGAPELHRAPCVTVREHLDGRLTITHGPRLFGTYTANGRRSSEIS